MSDIKIGGETLAQINCRMSDHPRDIRVNLSYCCKQLILNINVKFRGVSILNRDIFVPSMSNTSEYVKALEKEIENLTIQFESITDYAKTKVENIAVEEAPFNLNGWYLGKCKYPSVGHHRYCFIAFTGDRVHDQWAKLFFRFDKIDWEKTTNYSKNRIDQLDTRHVTGVPPAIMWTHTRYEDLVTKMIERDCEEIIKQANELPLNREGMREDYSWDYARIMMRRGDSIYPCVAGEMANPNAELVIAIFHSGDKKVKGFAMPVEGGHPIRLKKEEYHYSDERYQVTVDEGSIIKGYASTNTYSVGDPIHKGDEYIQYILRGILEEWKEEKEG
jgi:hypothetical protein